MNTISTSMAAERSVLYVSAIPDTRIVELLTSANWQVALATGTEATAPAASRVGLIELPPNVTQEQLGALQTYAQQVKVTWIALVQPGQSEDTGTRQFILDHCYDFITSPYPDRSLLFAIGHAYGLATLRDASRTSNIPNAANAAATPPEAPKRVSSRRSHGQFDMIGECDAMEELYRGIQRCARTPAPVFISGESGTGKELAALAIHNRSARSRQPYVAINCAAIPATLLQAELFGHERGAFTGALQQKIGRIESASRGTLFLDEIGDMPYACQAVLLRFLQEGTFERLGSNTPIKVDVRIISATHVDLEAAVAEGKFRADLYHRLCVLKVTTPPLREREADIDLLAQHALALYKKESQVKIRGFSADALTALRQYDWPGNVRELFNCIRRTLVMAENPVISAADLGLRVMPNSLGDALNVARAETGASAAPAAPQSVAKKPAHA
ncbi:MULTISPECIES: sigma-54 dependent transcriptional regulator [unclassified Paraburkholderia]|uniref:sigma-54 dependent transcriptional regulator n=1 Tax=unclassified Paraburkholderia TaxID=2615204 RepID=UPI002AB1FB3A|nr:MULTISPECIES: sigma-54 dependent transcriptional regulator [unclassified Paraburkholderia]